jgi:hypothetical protein
MYFVEPEIILLFYLRVCLRLLVFLSLQTFSLSLSFSSLPKVHLGLIDNKNCEWLKDCIAGTNYQHFGGF